MIRLNIFGEDIMDNNDILIHSLGNWEFYSEEIRWKGKTVVSIKEVNRLKWAIVLGGLGAFMGGIATIVLAIMELVKYYNK